jgi:alpha-galactosidase
MRFIAASLALLLSSQLFAQDSSSTNRTFWLDEIDLKAMTQRRGVPLARHAVGGGKLVMDGKTYERGIGSRSISELVLDLHGEAKRFSAVVGLDDSANEGKREGTVRFEVWVDDRKLADSGILKAGDAPQVLEANLTGARTVTLLLDDGGDTSNGDLANWADAKIELASPSSRRPTPHVAPPAPMPKIASTSSSKLAIHGPLIYGATPGRPFLYRVPATGAGSLRFSADGLPAGLQLDPQTGIITGKVTSAGTSDVRLKVTNAEGSAERSLRIVAGQNKLALTPPMGWNSWNVWGTAVDAAKVRAAADAMVSSGLAAHGYQFINIDDAWEGTRDANGEIQTNEKFGDMKALADYVHSKGLKIGIYSSPGPKTCAGYEGSFGHEEQDARTYARWGIDYLKFDWCSCQSKDLREPYLLMRRALDAIDRDIVYSLCQYGMGDVWTWGEAAGGNLWRTTGDISDSWGSMIGIVIRNIEYSDHARPGHWNDPDMLVVGKVGWGPSLHDSRLLPIEQQTHISLWAMMAAPLLVGCDMTQLDEFTRALLMNDEVIEIDQDPLGKPAKRAWRDGELEVWSRPLWDGTLAVCLLNRGYEDAQMSTKWSDLRLSGAQPVRDVWQQKDLGEVADKFETTVRGHGTVLLKIGRAQPDKSP